MKQTISCFKRLLLSLMESMLFEEEKRLNKVRGKKEAEYNDLKRTIIEHVLEYSKLHCLWQCVLKG